MVSVNTAPTDPMDAIVARPTRGVFRCTVCCAEWKGGLPSLFGWFWYGFDEDWPSCCDLPAWLVEPIIEPPLKGSTSST